MTDQKKKAESGRPATQASTQNRPGKPETKDEGTQLPNQSTKKMSGMKEGNGAGDGLMEHVRSTASETYDSATSKAAEKLEQQKTTLSSGLSNVASSFRKLSENFEGPESGDQISRIAAEYSGLMANKIEQAVGYFDRKDINSVYRDVEGLARQHPAWFVGGAFAIGFLAARFLKSSNSRSYSSDMTYRPSMPRRQARSNAQTQAI